MSSNMEEKSLSIEDKLDLKRKNRTERGKLSSDKEEKNSAAVKERERVKEKEKETETPGEEQEESNKRQKRLSFRERRASKGSFGSDGQRRTSFSDSAKIMRVSFSKPQEENGNSDEQSVLVHTVSVQPDSVLHVEVESSEKEGHVKVRGSFNAHDNKGGEQKAEESNYFVLNDGITVAKNVKPTEDIGLALSATADLQGVLETNQGQANAAAKEQVLKVLQTKGFDVARVDSASKIEDLLEEHSKGAQNSFYLCDVNVVIKKFFQWKELLPRVNPFYAMKCCPDPVLLWILKTLGTGFDVASMGETEIALGLNAPEDQIIFANPNKMKAHLEFAKSKNVRLMTFDGAAELHKVKEAFPEAQLVLRVLPPESKRIANTTFGSKFGATWDDCEELIDLAVKLGLNLRGVSYHVGSGCYDVDAFEDAVRYAKKVFDLADSKGVKMNFLDIGGGFPGSDDGPITIKDIANKISPVIEELFPPEVTVIAEPGRYFASACMTLASNIITVREKKVPDGQGQIKNQRLYYLSDGVYGSFNCIFYDHNEPVPHVLSGEKAKKEGARSSTLFGPTCDSIDVICKDISLPELEVGDWIYFPNMGAYTRAAGSNFNGFPIPKVVYICS